MTSLNNLEDLLIKKSKKELLEWLMEHKLIKNEFLCQYCSVFCKFIEYEGNIDGFIWRCMHSSCGKYKKRYSIRINSFFENFNISMLLILKVLIRYSCKTRRHAMIQNFSEINRSTIYKIINKLVSLIPISDFSSDKLGGPNRIVQIDETMLNFKCKSHRGRSPENRTDALCIVEYENFITRAFATVIPDKKSSTLVLIICSQVASNSIIWTDEHRSYSILSSFDYIHGKVCHKYEFVNAITGVNTQAVESFNNIIKCEIKARKGVWTVKRELFLTEICFIFNNSNNLFDKIMNLIKL